MLELALDGAMDCYTPILAFPESASAVLWFQVSTEGVTPPLPNFGKLLKGLGDVLNAAAP